MHQVNMKTKYNPKEVETGRYKQWVENGFFKPSGETNKKPYSIVIPPPNVTGKLHLGHAWDNTLQDILIRYKRMQGYDTLWLPGTDHAGIATQAKVEAQLRESGINRYDIGREKLIDRVWKWVDKYSHIIHQQWAKLGISVDYDRERFTLDDGLSEAVKKVFVDLYNKGLIYRGEYIINWDPEAQTALSDIEVIHKKDKGAFYYIKYPFVDENFIFNNNHYIKIATTRPETMFGDVAVAVNPNDKRYSQLIGKEVILPLNGRHIPIISDPYVDPEFGTGVVKITPAHDPNDFKVGERHGLEKINIMNKDATMNINAGKYAGMDRFSARKSIVKDLDDNGYLIKIDPIIHNVGHSERTGVQIESRLSTQWFIRMKPLAKLALENQTMGDKVNFVPNRFEHIWKQWMENVHDWVISRQLWWGHRIPAWYNKKSNEIYVGMKEPKDIENWYQDPDVLDTWFSSALWPFSTMGWPNVNSSDYQRYFPTNTLVTGYDIIFFWVSRMIFQSLEFTHKIPFKNVVLHGLARDEQGRKMSKSLGNGIDPINVIDKYGADALRWFLTTGSTPGQDIRFSYQKMDSAWNFINKIWNASRFVLMNLDDDIRPDLSFITKWNLVDKWIVSRLNNTINDVHRLLDTFEFGEVGRSIYNFFWNDFCDWYIEISKENLSSINMKERKNTQFVLCYVLDQILKLLHPILPFVTEKIWLSMPGHGKSLVIASYPKYDANLYDKKAERQMEHLIELIRSIRNSRSKTHTPLSSPIDIFIKTKNNDIKKIFYENINYIQRFCNPKSLKIGEDIETPFLSITNVITDAEVYLPLSEMINLNDEIKKLQNKSKSLENEIIRCQNKLSNENFIQNAPKMIVDSEKDKMMDYKNKLESIVNRIKELKSAINNLDNE